MSEVTLPLRVIPRRRFRVVLRWSVRRAPLNVSGNDFTLLCRYTRRWIHYGLFAHIAICTLVGAVEGVFGR